MKLYTFDAAPNPARLGMFMQYKGISLDTVQIDLGAEEQLGEAYRAIVPEATVPALVLDDSTVLCSVIAIAHYLESQYPDKPLLGRTPEERARVLNWNHRLYRTFLLRLPMRFATDTPTMSIVRYRGRSMSLSCPSWSSAGALA